MSATIALSAKYLRVWVDVNIMDETIWFYGYECRVGTMGEDTWTGSVSAPMSHPVRSKTIGEYPTLLLNGKWVMFTDVLKPRAELVMEVWDIAFELYMMQRDWDQLTPYEREYRIR